MNERRIHTFGYGNCSKEEAVRILQSVGVTRLYDIRSHRGSRMPHWNAEPLKVWPRLNGIEYRWHSELGGWSERDIEEAREIGIDYNVVEPYTHGHFPKTLADGNDGFTDYELYTTRPRYWSIGIETLLQDMEDGLRVAVMCLEQEWTRCHRRVVADSLLWLRDNFDLEPFEVWHVQRGRPPMNHDAVWMQRRTTYSEDLYNKWFELGGVMARALGYAPRTEPVVLAPERAQMRIIDTATGEQL